MCQRIFSEKFDASARGQKRPEEFPENSQAGTPYRENLKMEAADPSADHAAAPGKRVTGRYAVETLPCEIRPASAAYLPTSC